jgi:hypothetical protein
MVSKGQLKSDVLAEVLISSCMSYHLLLIILGNAITGFLYWHNCLVNSVPIFIETLPIRFLYSLMSQFKYEHASVLHDCCCSFLSAYAIILHAVYW